MMNRHAEEYGNDWYVYAGKFSEIEGMEDHVAKIAENHAANLEWIEKMRQLQNKPAPVDFIPVSPSTLPEIEHPYQLSGPEWEPPTPW